MQQVEPSSRTTQPIVTGTSVLAVKYAGGVMMMTDTLGSCRHLLALLACFVWFVGDDGVGGVFLHITCLP